MHGYRARDHMYVPCMAIPRVAHNKLHEMCMSHATRKHDPRKHVMVLFKVVSCCHTCTRM